MCYWMFTKNTILNTLELLKYIGSGPKPICCKLKLLQCIKKLFPRFLETNLKIFKNYLYFGQIKTLTYFKAMVATGSDRNFSY